MRETRLGGRERGLPRLRPQGYPASASKAAETRPLSLSTKVGGPKDACSRSCNAWHGINIGKVKQKSMVMLVRVTMQTHVKGSRGSGKVRRRDHLRKAQGHHGQGHGQGRSELHTLSLIQKSKYIQPIDRERSIWSRSQH